MTLTMLSITLILVLLPNDILSVSPYIPAFHFTPTPENWMNDPNAPFYDETTDLYHLFFQYKSPRVWGHAVSKDLFTWRNLPIALENNEPYDIGGVFSGSMTIVPSTPNTSSKLYITYSSQEQNVICMATPTNRSDPYLINWTNYAGNPIINISDTNQTIFRDPSSAWTTDNGKTYYFIYAGMTTDSPNGSGKEGSAQIVKTTDWKTFITIDGNYLYSANNTGPWSCPDFFKFPNSTNPNITHLLMTLFIGDHWAVGKYDDVNIRFIPYNGSDISSYKQMIDYGKCYASKSFFDARHNRQVRFGWIMEERPAHHDGSPYGWAGVQTLPRINALSLNYPSQLITPVIPEFNDLHIEETKYMQQNINIINGNMMFFDEENVSGNQLDIMMMNVIPSNNDTICGIWVLSDGENKNEYLNVGINYGKNEYFVDNTKASLNPNNTKLITNAKVFDWNGYKSEPLNLRVIVDHSVIEVYVNDGLSVMTRRAYPTLQQSVHVALYANGGNCSIQKFNSWNVYTTMWQ
eukprot:209416_1